MLGQADRGTGVGTAAGSGPKPQTPYPRPTCATPVRFRAKERIERLYIAETTLVAA